MKPRSYIRSLGFVWLYLTRSLHRSLDFTRTLRLTTSRLKYEGGCRNIKRLLKIACCSVRFLARNKARVLIEQLVVLSIYLSRHNILSTYDGDHICWHVMFGHRIESLWMGRARCSYFTTVGTIASITDQKDTKFSFRCFNCGIGRRSWYGKTFCIRFEMVNWGRVDRWSCSHLAGYWKKKLASAPPII